MVRQESYQVENLILTKFLSDTNALIVAGGSRSNAGGLIMQRQDLGPLHRYYKDLNRDDCSPLSASEEHRLYCRMKAGDQKAANQLVKANLRFVVSVAKQYAHQGVPLEDLV